MNQDDIYNLLLLMLLLSNEKENCESGQSTRGSLNELMLASMLFGSCNGRDAQFPSCPNRPRNNNTTF